MVTLDDFEDTGDTQKLFLTNITYTEQGGKPITHLFGRDAERNWVHQQVYGHSPHFSVPQNEYDDRIGNHYAVSNVSNGRSTLDGDDTYKIETNLPKHVGELKDFFDNPLEADVLYSKRFLIDTDITTGVKVPVDDSKVHVSDIEPCDPPHTSPKTVTVDIEVASESGFPDADDAEWPVVSIVATDSYSEQYVGWILASDDWDGNTLSEMEGALAGQEALETEVGCDDVRVFDDEQQLLDDFNQYIERQRPDILTGWHSNDFDYPYLINRCRNLDVWSYKEWSPLQEVYTSNYGPVCKGVSMLDMLGAYEKTQIHNLTDKSLEAIAQKELDDTDGKLDVEDGYTEMWRNNPVDFLRYNKVDVELVTEIDDEAGVTELFTNLRNITGVSYEDPVGGNFEIMDVTFLRKAKEYGYALPTAERPDVGDYHGAYVYDPVAGLHEHVVYPDWSSLYPNMMYQCNMSPETLIGTAEDLEDSPYTEDDCVWSYVDTVTAPEDKSDVEVDDASSDGSDASADSIRPATDERMEKVYFLAPDNTEGFVRLVLDDVMGLADEYSGGMYEAVKRVRNSAYGFIGDSDSYGDGSRLFNWQIAEAITLGGQKVLKEGGRMFADAVEDPDAEVIYGDTDSNVTTLPNSNSGEHALQKAMDATDVVNEDIDDYAAETFGLDSPEDSRMELEMESYASRIFFKQTKKRYAQLIEWNDSEGWLDNPEPSIKGFEYVRSDVAQITKDVQYDVLEALLTTDNPRSHVYNTVKQAIEELMSGDMDPNMYGIYFGMSKLPESYGSQDRTPQPQYRGAKYANEFIYGADAIDTQSDAMYYYVDTVKDGPYPKTYRSDTAENGRYVDAISVLDGNDIPDEVVIDKRKMINKTVLSYIEDIIRTMGWDYSELEDYLDRQTPASYYRDEGQTGLDADSFM